MSMTFAPVAENDRDALVAFMMTHAPIMMFPLSNVARYGLGGDDPRAMQAWVATRAGQITDALTVSQEGMVFPCCPTGNWTAAAHILQGRAIKGLIGDAAQVSALRAALGITGIAQLDVAEPSFVLDLAALHKPRTEGFRLCKLDQAPAGLIAAWRVEYEVETLNLARSVVAQQADAKIRGYIAVDTHRVLFKDDEPVSMTGFNAVLPRIVQVGGVYTPSDLRGRGYARTALAMHLAEVAKEGVTQAVLSAANEAAAQAYKAVGFARAGDFALVIYEDTQVAHG